MLCNELRAAGGGDSPHTSEMSPSIEMTWLAFATRTANTERWRGPPRATGSPSSTASTCPKTRNSIAQPYRTCQAPCAGLLRSDTQPIRH